MSQSSADASPASPRRAALAIVAACTIWGLCAFYYRMLSHIPPIEVLTHRTIWSGVFFLGFCLLTGRAARLREALRPSRTLALLAGAALMISVNWAIFIWAVTSGRITESALGYYIFPLVMAAMGAVLLGERFSRLQGAALGLAAAATLILALGLGAPPWVSLALALTFGLYGLIKKTVSTGPIVSVTAEVLLLAPFAIVWLLGAHLAGWTDFTGLTPGAFFADPADAALLAFSGVLTGAPLALYAAAAKGLPLSTLGMIAYLNPTLQFASAMITGEHPTIWHMIAFPMIWAGLAVFSLDALRRDRKARRAAAAARAVTPPS